MRLTKFTDYSLRMLMYVAAKGDDRATIDDAAAQFQISASHLKKVARHLTQTGFLTGTRGRTGGLALAKAAQDINLGDLVRRTEPDFGLFECFLPDNACMITKNCRLRGVGHEALAAFLAVFAKYSLADALIRPQDFLTLPPAH